MNVKKHFFVTVLLLGALPLGAEEPTKDPLMRAVATDGGKLTGTEKTLFRQSIRSAKESAARETLDVFYRDALDAYRQSKYDEALELLNNIYNVDPYYEDVSALRETITRIKYSRDVESKRGILDDYMRKGNTARTDGRNVQALNYWKQALTVNPDYTPAKKKIQEVNREMARIQYEEGYRNYKKKELELALDNWSNAAALDPTLKERGLLLMMTKTQLALQKGQSDRLRATGAQLFTEKKYAESLQAYEQLLQAEPRDVEARQMISRIRLQSGSSTFQAAKAAVAKGQYAQAIRSYQDCVRMGYEVDRAKQGIAEAQEKIRVSLLPKKTPAKNKQNQGTSAQQTDAAPPPPVVEKKPANPEEANKHYRQGLAAMRSKDYHHALEELELAAQFDPEDEHIYVARERARQEWAALNASK